MASKKRKPLGEKLIEAGLLSQEQLQVALEEQKRTGQLLGEILVGLKFVLPNEIAMVVAHESGEELESISSRTISDRVLKLIPDSVVMEERVIPIERNGNCLTLAMVDPFNVVAIDKIQGITGLEIKVSAITEKDFYEAFERFYGDVKSTDDKLEKVINEADHRLLIDLTSEGDAPVARLVNQIIETGIRKNATDIHIEPEENIVRIRYRIDGILRSGVSIPKNIQSSLDSRIKIMAEMNISERRIPQDGRIGFKMSGRDIDLRVSTMPTVYGENVVLRILDMSKVVVGLDSLGFSENDLSVFKQLLEKPFGVVLVTGPTGSGKTTTLYSGLMYINSLEKNVMTLEDPVEYRVPLIRQSQINPKAGLTFAVGLRAFLRQDPDVILVGEIRDHETVEMVIRASLTGHLVLSTVHTNDAASALPRLMDMGVQPYFIPSTIAGVVAQRLVRKICTHCKEPYEPTDEELYAFSLERKKGQQFLKGAGCEHCSGSGYKGRIAIFEILTMNKEIIDLVMKRESGSAIYEAARRNGMVTIREDGAKKAAQGITTLQEVMRVAERRLSVSSRNRKVLVKKEDKKTDNSKKPLKVMATP